MINNNINTTNGNQTGNGTSGTSGNGTNKNYGWATGLVDGMAKTTAGIATAKSAMEHIGGIMAWGDKYTGIPDKTNENLGVEMVKPMNYWDEMRKARDEEWAREDAIRAETQAREDNAIQRKVEDMKNAGINPNLALGMTGAASGGGITNQTGSLDYTMSETEYNKAYEMLMQEIELNYKGDQAEKDRIMNMIKALITGGAILGGAALKK